MLDILVVTNVTEFSVMPKKNNTKNIFSIQKNCLIISFCDDKEKVLNQSEICIEDAKDIAKIISNL